MPRNPATTAVVSVSLPIPMAQQVDRRRKADHRTRSELVRDALRFYLRAQSDIEDAGRQAYLDAKAGKGLSPIFETADEGLAHLHTAVKRHTVAKGRKKR
jgi:Arc/MetJ-type ribon-helix-helix transcriptional regulator